ncbi:MAG: metalloregulator ArsR/SmtB family transcription factor [Candidatus Acidiferrales bacterium]
MRVSGSHSAKANVSAVIFAALGDETRLRIVTRLCHEGPLSIARLTAGTNVTRQAITKHLRMMERAKLLHSERSGRQRVWRIDQRRIADARRHLDIISREWDDALSRLRAFVEQ